MEIELYKPPRYISLPRSISIWFWHLLFCFLLNTLFYCLCFFPFRVLYLTIFQPTPSIVYPFLSLVSYFLLIDHPASLSLVFPWEPTGISLPPSLSLSSLFSYLSVLPLSYLSLYTLRIVKLDEPAATLQVWALRCGRCKRVESGAYLSHMCASLASAGARLRVGFAS